MGNKALKEWAKEDIKPHQKRGNGRISALARHLGISQPAVTKIINDGLGIRFEYVQKIIDFTGIEAKDLLPEYYEFFKKDFSKIENDANYNISLAKLSAIADLEDAIKKIQYS